MMFWTTVALSLRSLAANKLRSVLAMLGIIIAVWSVISALALGAGAQASVLKRLSALGTNLLVIRPGQRGTGGVMSGTQQNLLPADAEALVGIPGVTRVAPVVRGPVQVKYFNNNSNVTAIGTTPTYFALRDFQVVQGRPLYDSDLDASARVCVIGPTTALNLFGPDFAAFCVGQSIAVKGVSYRVVGLTEAKGDQGFFNPDDQITVPYTTAMKQLLGVDHLGEIDVGAASQESLDAVQAKATAILRRLHHIAAGAEDDFSIRNQAEVISTATTITTVLSLLLGGIAGISLLVGGIGIMNIMLVTVAERTREIGVRKAIGARERDVLRQFLIESVVMSGLGGTVGLVLGFLTTVLLTAVQDKFSLVVRPSSVLLAIGFSFAVGVFFGYYPARRAARLDPIEALRYE